jgi:hypothetical protein
MQGAYESMPLDVLARATRRDKIDQATIELVVDFWKENSVVSPCVKDVIGSRRKGATPHPKHYLDRSQTDIYLAFKKKHPDVPIGQRRFEMCKPFFVVPLGREDRITCACK